MYILTYFIEKQSHFLEFSDFHSTNFKVHFKKLKALDNATLTKNGEQVDIWHPHYNEAVEILINAMPCGKRVVKIYGDHSLTNLTGTLIEELYLTDMIVPIGLMALLESSHFIGLYLSKVHFTADCMTLFLSHLKTYQHLQKIGLDQITFAKKD